MSLRVRGQEATLRFTIDGDPQKGTWVKVKDFSATPRTDLIEEDYIGELESDLDIQHHGFDLSWSVDVQDRTVIDYLDKIIAREQAHLAHPVVTVNVTYAFRGANGNPVAESYYNVFLKVNETSIGGRKEYINASFEAKAKKKSTLNL